MNEPRPTAPCRQCDTTTERYANGECAPCRRATSRRHYHRNPEQGRARSQRRRAEKPEAVKRAVTDWKAANAERGAVYQADWKRANAEHVREYQRDWHRQHPEANVQNVRRWQERYPEKARALKRSVTTRRRARKRGAVTDDHAPHEIFERDGATCQLRLHPDCRGDLDVARTRQWEIDHVHPISRGGSHTRENVQLACDRCNRSKGALTMQEVEARRNPGLQRRVPRGVRQAP